MSAYIVSYAHIDAIVSAQAMARANCGRHPQSDESNTLLGRELLEENVRSVAARYPDHAPDMAVAYAYRFTVRRRALTPVEAIKAIHCYEYQACEHDGWNLSDAKKICAQLISDLTTMLPGYDEAPWAIDA